MKSRVGERGQITIPMSLRHSLGLKAGDEVVFDETEGGIVIRRRSTDDGLHSLVGLIRERVDVDAYLESARGPKWNAKTDRKAR